MAKEKDPKLKKAGVTSYNKAKRTPNHPTKSHVVVARKADGSTKLIRFGQQGVTGATDKKGKKFDTLRRNFRKRHAKNIRKGKMSGAWWANKVKW